MIARANITWQGIPESTWTSIQRRNHREVCPDAWEDFPGSYEDSDYEDNDNEMEVNDDATSTSNVSTDEQMNNSAPPSPSPS